MQFDKSLVGDALNVSLNGSGYNFRPVIHRDGLSDLHRLPVARLHADVSSELRVVGP